MEQALSLYELNNRIRNLIEENTEETYWLQAELSEVNVNRNGHCYVEFVQKAPRGNNFLAKARGVIWANVYAMLAPYFEEQTGQRFMAGIKVMVEVQVTFHEVYGFSLTVVDIDPTYTLGDLARHRKEILQALEDEGILTLNKELELSVLPLRVAVISAPSAAGYGDFCNQLAQNSKGYAFQVQLFPAVMQGTQTEQSVISALNNIAAQQDDWDVVVIIRGGGATADLASFDTLGLAENVAQFPLPIITGIGHERDDTVLDLIAHTRVKTPTAAAEFLISRVDETAEQVENLAFRFSKAAMNRLQSEQNRLDRLVASLPINYQHRSSREEMHLQLMEQNLKIRIPQGIQHQFSKIELLEQRVQANNPERLLKKGYSITLKDGHLVTRADQLKKGDCIVTRLSQGQVESEIK